MRILNKHVKAGRAVVRGAMTDKEGGLRPALYSVALRYNGVLSAVDNLNELDSYLLYFRLICADSEALAGTISEGRE